LSENALHKEGLQGLGIFHENLANLGKLLIAHNEEALAKLVRRGNLLRFEPETKGGGGGVCCQ